MDNNKKTTGVLKRVRQSDKASLSNASYLLYSALLKNNASNYKIKIGGGNSNPNENLPEKFLNNADGFVVSRIGIFIAALTTAKKGSLALQTYPSEIVFGADSSTFKLGDLNIVYNGYFNITRQRQNILAGYGTREFLAVPRTQANTTGKLQNMFELNKFLRDIEPGVILGGADENTFELVLPDTSGLLFESVTSGVEHRVYVYMEGVEIPAVNKADEIKGILG